MMAEAPLFHREQVVGRVETLEESTVISGDEQVLIIRLERQAGLIKELMKEELISFDITQIPATQGH
jgi:hypothetical protein